MRMTRSDLPERGGAVEGNEAAMLCIERMRHAERDGLRRRALEEPIESVQGLGLLAQLRTHRPMDGGRTRPVCDLVKDGRIAVADDELFDSRGRDSQQAVPAPRENDGFRLGAQRLL